jgi:hypothetical protein
MSDEIVLKNAKKMFAKLGIKVGDLEKEDAKIEELAQSVVSGIVENNKSDIEIEAKKAATTAAYAKLQKQMVSTFGLDASKYESLTKGQLEAMLSDAKELIESSGKGEKANDPADVAALKKQLGELQELNKNAIKERDEFKAAAEKVPELLAQKTKEVTIGYERKKAVSETIAKMRENGVSKKYTDNMLLAEIFANNIDLEAIETADGIGFRVGQVVEKDGKKEFKPLKKSESETYNSLYDYSMAKVVKEDWLDKTAQPPITPTGGGAGADAGKIDTSKLPPALIKSLGL